MTSKEALFKLAMYCPYDDVIDDTLGIVEKDLEVLEILKKYIQVDYYEGNNLNIWGFSGIDLQDLKKKELKKVLRWLKDEQQ